MFKDSETTKLWGFKEIRYDFGNIKYIKEFKELFPQTKVIIHIRGNIQAQSQSGWFKGDINAANYLIKTTNDLLTFARENSDWCYISTFEKMFDKNNLQNIFEFIDCREKYDEQKVSEVLNNNLKDT